MHIQIENADSDAMHEHGTRITSAGGFPMNLCNFGSASSKSLRKDTRCDWTMFMFVTHKRKKNFRKLSHQQICEAGLRENEALGFKFGPIGFGPNHVHFRVDVPKRYSKQQAEIMLKRSSAARIFREKPNFLKLYPDRHFWSGYEHHESVGVEFDAADEYIRNQARHHGLELIRDVQLTFAGGPPGDTAPL